MIPRSSASKGSHKLVARSILLTALALGGCERAATHQRSAEATFAPITSASADAPVVVEEFQSQGCSSCPPANANINALAVRPEVLALSYAVTYWDQLGWKDTFDQPAFTQRQWDYAHHAGRRNIATPQVIVNGTTAIVGSNRAELQAAVAKEGSPAGGPAINAANKIVSIGSGKAAAPATVWLVRYDPNVQWVSIRAGENNGRKLPHRNIVRELTALGIWTGKPSHFQLPVATQAGLRPAILVQVGKGGPIIAARRI
jgi:hypothetical protein